VNTSLKENSAFRGVPRRGRGQRHTKTWLRLDTFSQLRDYLHGLVYYVTRKVDNELNFQWR